MCARLGLTPARYPKFEDRLLAATIGTPIEGCGFRRGRWPAGGIFEVPKDRLPDLSGLRSEELPKVRPLVKNRRVIAIWSGWLESRRYMPVTLQILSTGQVLSDAGEGQMDTETA